MNARYGFLSFFIPIYAYLRDYLVICPICRYGFQLNKLQFEQAKRKVKINNALIEGKISIEEFKSRMHEIKILEEREKKGEIRFVKKLFKS